MSRKQPDLAKQLAEAGHSRRRSAQEEATPAAAPQRSEAAATQAPSRQGTRPITGHFPKEVRDQLKMMGIEHDKTMQGLIAEALNDLFAKYHKPEIAPLPARDRDR